jgi:CRP-like cAMP-binding protein
MSMRKSIPPAVWEALIRSGTQRVFSPGTPLMRQGESATFVIALSEGTTKVTKDTVDGQQVLLALRGPDELFGELGVLLDTPRTASVRAVTRCVGHTIPAPAFRSVVGRFDLLTDTYRLSVTRALQMEERLQNLLCHPPAVRMARFLAHLADEVGEQSGDATIVHLGMDREELGFMLNMCRSAAIDTLGYLKSLNLIESGRKTIKVLNRDALASYTSQELWNVS